MGYLTRLAVSYSSVGKTTNSAAICTRRGSCFRPFKAAKLSPGLNAATCQSVIALVYGMPRMAEKSVRNRSVS
jgi:hypothetical protein